MDRGLFHAWMSRCSSTICWTDRPLPPNGFCGFVKRHSGVFESFYFWGLCSVPSTCAPFPFREDIQPLCLSVYSAKQEFLFLTTMPEVRKLPEEKHIPEELKVGTARPWSLSPRTRRPCCGELAFPCGRFRLSSRLR